MSKKRKGASAPRAVAVRPNGEILFYGFVGDEWNGFDAQTVIQDIDGLGEVDELVIRINSAGGLVWEGMAIFNYLKGHPAPKTIYIDAMAASMASILAMVGDKIIMPSNTTMMIHNPATAVWGESDDFRRYADLLEKIEGQAVAIYAARSGQNPETIAEMMDQETWMTAEEALDLGFCDEVIDASAPRASLKFDLTGFKNVPSYVAASVGKGSIGNGAERGAAKAVEQRERGHFTMKLKGQKGSAAGNQAEKTGDNIEVVAETPDMSTVQKNAVESERERIRAIGSAVRAAKLSQSVADDMVDRGLTIEQAKVEIVDKWVEADQAPEPHNQNGAVITGDVVDRFRAGAEMALLMRAGIDGGEQNEFTGLTLRELARESLNVRNISSRGMVPMQMIGVAFAPAMAGHHTTSDFANVLSNVANKAMLKGFDEAEETFQVWTGRGILTDFKAVSRVDIGLFDALPEIEDGAEYSHGTFGDRAETIQLATYGKKFAITRHAIINDDVNAFTQVPRKMGRAAIRTVGNLVYAVLTTNGNMSDGKALFHADHGNLAGTAGAPSTATLNAMRVAMAKQKDPESKASGGLNIRPAHVITPVALEGTAKVALESEYDTASGDKKVPNSVRGMAGVVSDARLDTSSSTVWYGAANANMHDTIEVAYLDGVDTPYLETRDGWDVDGVEMKVRMDAGVKALDFRGLFKNAGA